MYSIKELLQLCRDAIPVSNANAVYHLGQAILTAPADRPLMLAKEAEVFLVVATAAAIKAAQESGVNLHEVLGSGPDGQVTKADVDAYAEELTLEG